MANIEQHYQEQLAAEIRAVPPECIPALIKVVHAFREGVTQLPTVEESFKSGWRDVMAGQTHPIETLWDGLES